MDLVTGLAHAVIPIALSPSGVRRVRPRLNAFHQKSPGSPSEVGRHRCLCHRTGLIIPSKAGLILPSAAGASLFKKFERSDKKSDGCWAYKPIAPSAINVFPDEIEAEEGKGLPEGAVFERLINAYERNPLARQKCIKKYGTKCYVCGFSFGSTYGKVVEGLIHVHHLLQLSRVGKDYKVDPVVDLRPVCPNCHAVIHHRPKQPYSIEEVRSFLAKGISEPLNDK